MKRFFLILLGMFMSATMLTGCGYNEIQTLDESFNPRSRVGSDSGPIANLPTHAISIHAPAWGDVYKRQDTKTLAGIKQISIHAPAWGATWCA